MHSDSETIGASASLPCKTESTEDLISRGVNVVFETSNQDDGSSMWEGTYATATVAAADARIARNNLIARQLQKVNDITKKSYPIWKIC